MSLDGELDDEEKGPSAAHQLELIKSYLSFGRRAVSKRRSKAIAIFLVVVAMVSVALVIWPRSYQSELRMMVQKSAVLDPDDRSSPLASASDVITRHENVEELVKQLELGKRWDASRAPALRVKDRIMEALWGRPSEQQLNDALVTMLENRVWAKAEENSLTIGAEWSDAETAARIVDAAKESFLASRHVAEISVIEEKMSILEGHSAKLRAEIEGIAHELGRLKDEKIAAAERAARRVSEAAAGPAAPAPPSVRAAAPRAAAAASAAAVPVEEDLPELKEELGAKKRKLTDLQARRSQSLLEWKGKLVDLKLKFTDDHPEVRSAEQRIAILGQVPSEESALSTEVEALEMRVKRADANARLEAAAASARPRSGGGSAPPAVPAANDTLPSEILRLLDTSGDMDPAVSAQLSTALSKYSELRGEIRSARIRLDTAQAAFNYRYKIVAPASLPAKPHKPKVPMILAIGVLAALGLALLVPIALELKTGIIVERWQVHQLPIPVLGELSMPPRDT
jgi:capsular polysaccharide biosynthesis protein